MDATRISRSRCIAALMSALLVVGCTGAGPSPSPSASAAPSTPAPSTPAPNSSQSPSPAPGETAPNDVVLVMADTERQPPNAADAGAAANAINAFGFDLHRHLAASGGGNVVSSPVSIAIALGMARTGARGETAAEMDDVLYDVASDDHANWLNALDQALAGRTGTFADDAGTTHEVTLDIANAYFAQRGLSFEAPFLEGLAARYGAGMHLVDFVTDLEAARALINAWAAERTRGRIPEVLQPPDLTTATRLALVNAIYLKAPWYRPFDVDRTTTESFMRPDGSTVEVPMMHSSSVSCATGPDWVAADIPYTGGELSMLVIVPDDLEAFEARLDADLFDGIVRSFAEQIAQPSLALPRFDVDTRATLADALGALGMGRAFDPAAADFTGMTTDEQLFIGSVIHQATISVDEKGTEAAAVTVVGMDTGGGPEETCDATVNRPFLFALRDRTTGVILFLGRVTDPLATD